MPANPDDVALGVRFYHDAVENPAKSREAGRAIFDEVEMIEIAFPGDKNRKLITKADTTTTIRLNGRIEHITYAERFPEAYDQWQKGGEGRFITGTPLSEVGFLTTAQKAELGALNIYTVETLAALDGQPLKSLKMSGTEWKTKAQEFLDNADARVKLADMQRQMEAMKAELEASKNKRPVEEKGAEAFAHMDRAAMREYIKDHTGEAPKGNPSDDTLRAMCSDVKAAA